MKLRPIQPRITTRAPGGDGPHHQPGLLDEGVGVGQSGRGSGEDVSHVRYPPHSSMSVCVTPFHHAAEGPVDALDHPPGSGPGPAVRVESAQHLVPQPCGLVDGNQGVEDVVVAAAGAGHGQHQQEGLLRVQLGLLVQGGVLEGVLPALGELFLAALDPVGRGEPLPGVGVADGVEEDIGPAAEDGTGHEVAVLLPLHHLAVEVDQPDVAGAGGWGLGQGDSAGGYGGQGRHQQRRRQENQAPGFAGPGDEPSEHGRLLSDVDSSNVRQQSVATRRGLRYAL